jgi:AbrB family looped-hinge helix DNA binding protein
MNLQTTVSSKDQVVIPKDVRDRLKITAGERLEVVERPELRQQMKAVDANILVRFLIDDDPSQSRAERNMLLLGAFISNSVLLETVRLLESGYRQPRKNVAAAFVGTAANAAHRLCATGRSCLGIGSLRSGRRFCRYGSFGRSSLTRYLCDLRSQTCQTGLESITAL